jgi:hypothetical protein
VEIVDRRAYASVSEDWWIMKIALITIGLLATPSITGIRSRYLTPFGSLEFSACKT